MNVRQTLSRLNSGSQTRMLNPNNEGLDDGSLSAPVVVP